MNEKSILALVSDYLDACEAGVADIEDGFCGQLATFEKAIVLNQLDDNDLTRALVERCKNGIAQTVLNSLTTNEAGE